MERIGVLKNIDISRRQTVAIILGIILLLSFSGVSYYYISKSDIRRELGNAEFKVVSVDIIGSTDNGLIATGKAKIDKIASSDLDMVTVESLELELSNQSTYITTLTLPLSNKDFSDDIDFEVTIPVDTQKPSKLTKDILSKVLLAEDFQLHFTGTIVYKIRGITDKLEFTNTVLFALNQKGMDVVLNEILTGSDNTSNRVNFQVFNPISSTIDISGMVELIGNGTAFGQVNLHQERFPSNWTTIEEAIILYQSLPTTILHLMRNINNQLSLKTSLNVSFGELTVEINPTLTISASPTDIGLLAIEFNSVDLIEPLGTVEINFDANISINIPIPLNITAITAMLTSSSGSKIGTIQWDHSTNTTTTSSIRLQKGMYTRLHNITIHSSFSYMSALLGSIAEGEVMFTDIVITILLEGIEHQILISAVSVRN